MLETNITRLQIRFDFQQIYMIYIIIGFLNHVVFDRNTQQQTGRNKR